jgi:hypothetical protein
METRLITEEYDDCTVYIIKEDKVLYAIKIFKQSNKVKIYKLFEIDKINLT